MHAHAAAVNDAEKWPEEQELLLSGTFTDPKYVAELTICKVCLWVRLGSGRVYGGTVFQVIIAV